MASRNYPWMSSSDAATDSVSYRVTLRAVVVSFDSISRYISIDVSFFLLSHVHLNCGAFECITSHNFFAFSVQNVSSWNARRRPYMNLRTSIYTILFYINAERCVFIDMNVLCRWYDGLVRGRFSFYLNFHAVTFSTPRRDHVKLWASCLLEWNYKRV